MTPDQKTHVLIVYENAGAGHKKLAKILEQYLSDPNVRITLRTSSELIDEKQNLLAHHWNVLIKKNWIFLADIWLNFVARIFLLPFYYSLYSKNLFRSLDSLKPDIIISTADVNRLLGSYCQVRQIPFFICITSGAIFIDMLSPHATHIVYFQETAEIIQRVCMTKYFKRDITPETSWSTRIQDILYLLARYSVGYLTTPYFLRYHPKLTVNNNLKVVVVGPLREKLFYQSKTNIAIKNHYNIPEDGHCVLISNGNFGGNIIVNIVNTVLQNCNAKNTLNLITICGADSVLYAKMQAVASSMSTENVRIIPIAAQESLADLYQIADCSIGRGTAGILMDSVVSKTPLIVLEKVTTNDFGTLDIIKKYKIGAIAKSIAEIATVLDTIILQKTKYAQALNDFVAQYGVQNIETIQSLLKKTILVNKREIE